MKEEKKATRQSYGEMLEKLGEENKDIVVLDADLSAATKQRSEEVVSLLAILLCLIPVDAITRSASPSAK